MLLILALNSPIQEKNKLKENLVIIENEKVNHPTDLQLFWYKSLTYLWYIFTVHVQSLPYKSII